MNGRANTTVSILRGAQRDEFDDEIDSDTVAASGMLASLHETAQRSDARVDGGLRQVGMFTLRVRGDADVQLGDRVLDERSGFTYVIEEVVAAPSISRTVDVRCSLRRVATA